MYASRACYEREVRKARHAAGVFPITARAQHRRPTGSPQAPLGSWWLPFASGDRRDAEFMAVASQRFPEMTPWRSMSDLVRSANGVVR